MFKNKMHSSKIAVRTHLMGLDIGRFIRLTTIEGVSDLKIAVLLHVGAVVLQHHDRVGRNVNRLHVSHLLHSSHSTYP